jgi:phenylacetate-CoA ligase
MAAPFLNRLAIESSQLEQIRRLLSIILPSNGFYARKLAAAGEITSLEDFQKRVPFTTKGELVMDQREHPPFGTNLTFPTQRYTRFHQTSGTEGAPLRWLDDPESWKWMVGNWKRVFEAAGVTQADRVLFAFSFGPFIGFWLAFGAATELGCLSFPTGGLSTSARLHQIIECEATVVCCTPSYGLRLVEVANEEGLDLRQAKVRLIMVAGEPGGSVPATRQQLERLWHGARVFDHHGMTEVGPVTFECPARPGVLHVFGESYLAEVVDPSTGNPLPYGEAGELVLTTLGRIGSPALRYRTGDLVKALTPSVCACGRSDLALEGGILSRVDDMIVVRGVNIYPSAVDEIIRGTGQVAEYRVHVNTSRALAELQIEVEPVSSDAGNLKEALEKALDRAFSMRIPVECVSAGSLPRFDLKARRWIRTA